MSKTAGPIIQQRIVKAVWASAALLSAIVLASCAPALPGSNKKDLHHCFGRVQTRPCNQELHSYKRNVYNPNAKTATKTISSKHKAASDTVTPEPEISEAYLERLRRGEGVWRGRVQGTGIISVWLHLKTIETSSQPETEEKILVGKVILKDDSSSFAYRATLPRAKRWDWALSASAEPLPKLN